MKYSNKIIKTGYTFPVWVTSLLLLLASTPAFASGSLAGLDGLAYIFFGLVGVAFIGYLFTLLILLTRSPAVLILFVLACLLNLIMIMVFLLHGFAAFTSGNITVLILAVFALGARYYVGAKNIDPEVAKRKTRNVAYGILLFTVAMFFTGIIGYILTR